ncbi:hemerythrin domain-containing protein [Nonomuraea sediminis]|uniref:hemerythrin domain-containing protein n=1 Tax=Nonomuraea sediminis TaxID=2835864 RepID=UPI001BDD5704|nr:hemerythrin domain-containing protein [Nonomuraea sediminis]
MSPNLLGIRIMHRAMRADARRLALLVEELAAGRQQADQERLRAIAEFATRLCAGIHHHHRAEDEALWPVLARSAGPEVDLDGLTEDHEALDPLLEEITDVAARLQSDTGAPASLAKSCAALADLLDEHIEEEERLLFPVILRYVSESDWQQVENAARKGGDIRFDLPRIAQYAHEDELAELRRAAGPVLMLLLRLLNRGHLRRQRLIFGQA